MTLSSDQITRFIEDGFVRIDNAFTTQTAAACRDAIDRAASVRWNEPATWRSPVIRLPLLTEPCFRDAANTATLHAAWDQLLCPDRWIMPQGLGSFVLRFPVAGPVEDDGWHIDVSFAGPESDPNDFLSWRANVSSRGRGLLMLFLFTDVSDADGPTRIRIGSHRIIARRLQPFGDAGLSLRDMAANDFSETKDCNVALASGAAGTVYLCHPFVVHAAQRNSGAQARYLAQPPLLTKSPLMLERADSAYNPVERAIRLALNERA